MFRKLATVACVFGSVTTLLSTAAATGTAVAAPSAPASVQVTEYYHGQSYVLSPTNWHGATQCAIVTPTSAHCFDTPDELDAFTSSSGTASAAAQTGGTVHPDVSCSGYTKIWNGVNWTGTGLAFADWGFPQNLNSYTTVPFKVISWFSDGQRGYSPNNCNGTLYSGANGTGSHIALPKNAEAKNLGTAFPAYSIELDHP